MNMENVCGFYANTMPFYKEDLSICMFWYLGSEDAGVLEPVP
jgi:hypothetical protein